ncbi:MAG: hypothetical protein COB81_00325 [Flavobacteriaceae bacterium]|nr:MAG: hypothetical protein COB81_00325 [Flavobacteriaceae bacterium]
MIPQKITKTQIELLYKFTRKHFVEHYDVQTELVDHLANDIEQIWQEKPSLSFDEAKDISFKKFGVFGFMGVVEAKVAAMNKKYWLLIRRFMKEFFQWPQALSTLCLFLTINLVLSQEGYQEISLMMIFGLVIIGMFVQLFRLRSILKKRLRLNDKKWILEEMVLNTGGMAGFSYMPFQFIVQFIIQFGGDGDLGVMAILLLSLFLSIYILLLYTVAFVIPSKMTELLEAQYPEYKMMA